MACIDAPHPRVTASLAALCLAARSAGGDKGLPTGLIVRTSILRAPHEVAAGTVVFTASLDCRMALDDKPGGDAMDASFLAGVEGVVPREVSTKRQF